MRAFGGWYFPSHETHLIDWMTKRNIRDHGRVTYQYDKLQLALSHTSERRVAVDVGAHIGLMSFYFAHQFERVEAFEPIPYHRQCFLRNVTAENVVLHGCALGAHPGLARMTTYRGNSGHSHMAGKGEIEVPVCTLDEFELNAVDLLKVDCEGYERQVLEGAAATLNRCTPTVLVEQKAGNGSRYGYSDSAALEFLYGLGARQVASISGDYVFVW